MSPDSIKRPTHVTVYGNDHSPWVQAVLMGLHDARIPHVLVNAPPLDVFLDSAETVERFGVFYALVAEARPNSSASATKIRGDYLVSALHGIAHCRITMSGYPWSPTDELVELATASALRPR